MLEAGIHQAAELCALAGENAPRMVALASHGDRRSELPLLWQLCAAWTSLGYPVVVLDATMTESEQQPGLLQLLHNSDDFGRIVQGPEDWPIVPAALGLAELSQPAMGSGARVQQLSGLFHNYEIVLVYARATDLAAALPGSGMAPLLAVSAGDATLLSAYQALKHLLNKGKLRPTIVAVMDDPELATRVSGHSISRNLQECARDFLACEIPALTVCPGLAEEIRQLALRAMEGALVLPRWDAPGHALAGARPAARSH
jgi:hypothetical protein